MEELLVLQQREFQILAAAMGLKFLYGIPPMEDMAEDYLYVVHEMVGKEILKPTDLGFSVQEPYRSAMYALKGTQTIMAVERKDDTASVFYYGTKLVCMEESIQDADAIRIGLYAAADLYNVLEERGFLPSPYLDADLAMLQTEDDFKEWLGDFEKIDELPFFLRYQIFDNNKRLIDAFYLIDNPCNYWVARQNGIELSFSRYIKNDLYNELKAYMEDEKV